MRIGSRQQSLHRQLSYRLVIVLEGAVHPRPTNGILVAITVMNSTLASSGRPAM